MEPISPRPFYSSPYVSPYPPSASASSSVLRSRSLNSTAGQASKPSAASSSATVAAKSPSALQQRAPSDSGADGWRMALKRRRLGTSLQYNLIMQALLLFFFSFRPSLNIWHLLSFSNMFLYVALVLVPQLLLIAFVHSSSVESVGQLFWSRVMGLVSRRSSLNIVLCMVLVSQLQLWFTRALLPASAPFAHALMCAPRYSGGVALFAVVFAVVHLLRGRTQLRFPSLQIALGDQLKARLPLQFLYVFVSATLFYLVFSIMSRFLDPLPLLAPAFRWLSSGIDCSTDFSYSVEISSFLFLLFLGMSWSMTQHIVNIVLTQSVLAEDSAYLPPSFLPILLSQDADLYTKYLAALELYDAAQRSPSTRFFLFNDGNGKTWTRVCDTCTSILDSLSSSLYDAIETPELSRSFWHLDASRQRTQELFSRLPLQIWCCQSLSFLAFHSLAEDEIGVFQRSLEGVLSSMLKCSLAIKSYVRSQSFLSYASSQKLNGRQVLRLEPFSLSLALDNAIYRIVGVFYSHLKEFSFPLAEAERLRHYAAFEE